MKGNMLLLALLGTVLFSVSASAGWTFYGGDNCISTKGKDAKKINNWAGIILNGDKNKKKTLQVTCPMLNDEGKNLSSVYVYVYRDGKATTKSLSCTVMSKYSDGDTYDSQTVSTNSNGYDSMYFGSVDETFGALTLTCQLPAKAKITGYEVSEF